MTATDMNPRASAIRKIIAGMSSATVMLCLWCPFVHGFETVASAGDLTASVKLPGRTNRYASVETLRYQLRWAAFSNAAAVQLDVLGSGEKSASALLHLRATLHSLPPLRNLYPVDDRFDSFSDARSMESRQYEFHLDEMGEKENRINHLAPLGGGHTGGTSLVVVPAGTQDPLGILYSMRNADWKREPRFRAMMYDGHDVFEVRAQLEVPSERIAVGSKNYSAAQVDVGLFAHGEQVPKTALSIWFADDDAHTPVLLDAAMPYGNIRAELLASEKQ